eukprot:1959646-Amphidinium_carterae.1
MCAVAQVVIANNVMNISTEFTKRQGDPQDPNLPCAYLCSILDVPLPTDLRNQVLTGALRYDFGRLQAIHDRGSVDQIRE